MSQISVPSHFDYRMEVQVQNADIRSATVIGGIFVSHVTYATLIPLVDKVFDGFLEHFSWSKSNIAGANIIIPKLEVDYRSEAREGERLDWQVAVTNLGRKSCDLIFFATKIPEREEVATVKVSLVFYDYKARKTLEIPKEFREKFSE